MLQDVNQDPGPETGIAIYAELLPNIQQVSVAAALSSPLDASTSAEVVDSGRRIRVRHHDHALVVELPATVAASTALPLPQIPCSNLIWRLSAAVVDARAFPSVPENQAIPWASPDLQLGSVISCRTCGNEIVPRDQIKVWKDLPSENWAEMMEFWHCHKPHDSENPDNEALADRAYGANSAIAARPGVGFVDVTSFMFSEQDCHHLLFSSSPSGTIFKSSSLASDQVPLRRQGHVFCGDCRTQVGIFAPSSTSISLFKWQITCETLLPGRIPDLVECLAATLLAAISRSACAKSVVAPYVSDGEKGSKALHLWVLNANMVYTSSARQGRRVAMKMLYREISSDEGNGLVDSITSNVQEISLPKSAIEAVRTALEASTALMPERERSFKDWSAGLLDRWATEVYTSPRQLLLLSGHLLRSTLFRRKAMHVPRHQYIPAGCLTLTQVEDSWATVMRCCCDTWTDFRPQQKDDVESDSHVLPEELQTVIFDTICHRDLGLLFHAGWIDLQLRFSFTFLTATFRVYLLPDDTCNDRIDRSKSKLKKARANLLRLLDVAPKTWKGECAHSPSAGFLSTPGQVDDDESLLQLFNSIQSPSPEPGLMQDPHIQDAMCDLMTSSVPGLNTELYPYQRRSAALMLQKETQPGRSCDPRLISAKDQDGKPFYLDTVAGTVRREPRYYDGVLGGILAEEMGSGKTLICLALILASKGFPTKAPDLYACAEPPTRKTIVSLADMAASCAVRNSVPWKPWFENWRVQFGFEFDRCLDVFKRNPAHYIYQAPISSPRRQQRRQRISLYDSPPDLEAKTIYLSTASLVIAPNNLVFQWKQEIEKHTSGLRYIVLVKSDPLPTVTDLLHYDIVLFSQSRFEQITGTERQDFGSLGLVHFKRCIVDEGHKLGNSNLNKQSLLLQGLRGIKFSARWIVTGTPSHGLFGVDEPPTEKETSTDMEKKDIQRLGSMATLYLGARPWANTSSEAGDEPAKWDNYLLLPKHNPSSQGRWDYLKSTLNSLIVRHRLAEVGQLLPPVEDKIVVLEGSYQDRLSLNIFAMMIIFNSVQSERKDQDYFFHPRQRKSLLQIVHNLKQTTFFGGSFFSSEEIATAVETAETFLLEGKVSVSEEDEKLLREAIEFGHVAVKNTLRSLSHSFHEIPVCVEQFPANAGQAWSLDGKSADCVSTSASLLSSLQRIVHGALGAPEQLNSLLNGGLVQKGKAEMAKMQAAQQPDKDKTESAVKLAGNTKLGDDSPKKSRSHRVNVVTPKKTFALDSLPAPLQATKMVATASAKLSYLLGSIARHQQDEKMIVFYENESTAWYLASMLEVLQIQHLIYARGLTTERRALYVDTFHRNPVFRVLLMDISQAAFGLDMREASRIYFINPVLNPQVEAQAVGRLRRISQQKPVTVETLVLKNSIDEVILERKRHMTQAEHRQAKTILDIQPIYNWIKNAKVVDLPDTEDDGTSQMAALCAPQPLFGQGFGGDSHKDDENDDEDDVCLVPGRKTSRSSPTRTLKRSRDAMSSGSETTPSGLENGLRIRDEASPLARRVRFMA
ncbi:hypothetical protein CP532_6535 [Ophiocordyceps camponoti-leonardi (nom. inval.)]|nr:hypothetical protein CP532_6535 [Ophiocordyceps camponoti-leonardi (nom. inval.)]